MAQLPLPGCWSGSPMENVGSSVFPTHRGVSEEGSKAMAADFRMGLKCGCPKDPKSTDGAGRVGLMAGELKSKSRDPDSMVSSGKQNYRSAILPSPLTLFSAARIIIWFQQDALGFRSRSGGDGPWPVMTVSRPSSGT